MPGERHDNRVVLAGDDVRVRDDDPRRDHPAAALDAEPAGGAEDAHDARRRGPHSGLPEHPRIERLRRYCRACDRRERIDAAERAEGSRGGTSSLRNCSSCDSCALPPELGLARHLESDGPDRPRNAEPVAAPRTRPPASQARAAAGYVHRATRHRADHRAETPGRAPRGAPRRKTGERRVGRRRPAVEELRRQARADDGAEHDPPSPRALATSPRGARRSR